MPKSPAIVRPRSGRATPSATIVHAGERINVGDDALRIGRLEDNDLAIPKDSVSRHHASISHGERGHWIADLDSKNGTQLNGERFRGESRWLANGDTIVIGGEVLRFLTGEETRFGAQQPSIVDTRLIRFSGDRLAIGRDGANDLVLDDPNISRFHCEVIRTDGRVELRDLWSRNGTRVDGQPVQRAELATGSEIGIGPYRLIFDGTGFVERAEHGHLRLDAERVAMHVKDKQILAETSLSVEPGEFVAVIGESGSGKSTLIKALAGVTSPSSGTVAVNGQAVATRLTDIGYLPQDEIVHSRLTVLEALRYSARLRLPADTTDEEIDTTVARVLDELDLSAHAYTRIGSLSGGQRKRVGVAAELLSRPSLLFLDEPTTGLDPGLESRMMSLLRDLADNARAVLVVTHATKNLGLCDKLVVMGQGGVLCYQGSPAAALEFFEGETYDDIYTALDSSPAVGWREKFAAEHDPHPVPVDAEAEAVRQLDDHRPRRRTRMLQQAAVLTQRYAQLFTRDRRNLLILVGQVPVLALAIAGLFDAGAFRTSGGTAADATKLTFFLVTIAVWLGAIDAAREIIKERSVFVRETAVGVRISAYLLSKAAVLVALAAVQMVMLAAVVFAFQPLHESPRVYATVFSILFLTSVAAVGMGLLVSAAVKTQDQATSFIPLVLIPQLFFGGSIVAVEAMSGPVAALSKTVIAQWSYAGFGAAIDLNARIAADQAYARVSAFGTSFFDLSAAATYAALAAFIALFFLAVALLLRSRAHE